MTSISTDGAAALQGFLDHLASRRPLFHPAVAATRDRNAADFDELGSVMAAWAARDIGPDFARVLTDGYVSFVTDVNRSQIRYERAGRYANKSYAEVNAAVYGNPQHMQFYHWGVYVTTFAWEHHLRIYRFFRDYYLPLLGEPAGSLLDLGSGSGIWSSLALHALPGWRGTGVDISATSVDLSNQMTAASDLRERVTYKVADALTYEEDGPFDSCISCFLLEHLETPEELFANVHRNLKTRGYAFMTGALTAAEVDHIREFRRESELVQMAEEAGFRVVATYSGSPAAYPQDYDLLPRSMALLLQKRANEVW